MQLREIALELTKVVAASHKQSLTADEAATFVLETFKQSYKAVTTLGKEEVHMA